MDGGARQARPHHRRDPRDRSRPGRWRLPGRARTSRSSRVTTRAPRTPCGASRRQAARRSTCSTPTSARRSRCARSPLTRSSDIRRIDVLVNNAGAIFETRTLTADGIERTWALNHLAPFLLTTLLVDRLKASAPARIITTTSDAHKGKLIPFDDLNAERSYRGRGFTRYGETKLANILFTLGAGPPPRGNGCDRVLLPSRPGGDGLQPQQRRAHARLDDDHRALLTQPREGCADHWCGSPTPRMCQRRAVATTSTERAASRAGPHRMRRSPAGSGMSARSRCASLPRREAEPAVSCARCA